MLWTALEEEIIAHSVIKYTQKFDVKQRVSSVKKKSIVLALTHLLMKKYEQNTCTKRFKPDHPNDNNIVRI